MRDVTARREREAIVEEERARIARDLHDGVAQTLYFAALQADAGRQQLARDPERVADTLQEIGIKIRQVIRDVRRTIFALRPLDWSEGSFLEAVQRFASSFGEQMGWQLHTDIAPGLPPVPPPLQPTLFRLVQESLNNVAKHAGASQVWLSVAAGEVGSLQLAVRDDGTGFDPHQTVSGLGLEQMKCRVRRSGGSMTIASTAGGGTTVSATLPIGEVSHE
jgi:signal transduction histidine kinase